MKEHIQQKIISLCGSQSELARRLGKNSQTVSVWFRTQVASTEVLNACRALDWKSPRMNYVQTSIPTQQMVYLRRRLNHAVSYISTS